MVQSKNSLTKQLPMIILLYNIKVRNTLKPVNNDAHGKDDNSIENIKSNKKSDEIAYENIT